MNKERSFKLDGRYNEEEITQLAGLLAKLPEESKLYIGERFDGWHSKEFYEGLLAGYKNMRFIMDNLSVTELAQHTEQIMIFIADYIAKLPKNTL